MWGSLSSSSAVAVFMLTASGAEAEVAFAVLYSTRREHPYEKIASRTRSGRNFILFYYETGSDARKF
jgi:hypothetical protein